MNPSDEEFRAAWPRVVRVLAGWCGSLDLAEEHAAEAMARAVSHDGPIDDLAAWAVRVAQRSFLDDVRRRSRFDRLSTDLVRTDRVALEFGPGGRRAPDRSGDPAETLVDTDDLPDDLDDRVALLFVACDDALPRPAQMVLALRVVCGLSIAEIAVHLGVRDSAAAARLTRAKKALGEARGRFAVPDRGARAARLPVVLDCVAGMFTVAHREGAEQVDPLDDVAGQALSIADALVRLYPQDPEVRGLRALVLLGLARRPGRLDAGGVALTLDEVDRGRWDRRLLEAGLRDATFATDRGSGRFAIEAALSGLHSAAPSTAATDWARVVQLYDALAQVWPSPAVEVARWVARTRADAGDRVRRDAERSLTAMTEAGPAYARRDAAFALADLLWREGRRSEASDRYDVLAELATSESVRRFCRRRAAATP